MATNVRSTMLPPSAFVVSSFPQISVFLSQRRRYKERAFVPLLGEQQQGKGGGNE